MLLYHTGFQVIKEPDVHYGRKNADFGQGFYLTADRDFARRWATARPGEETIVNSYELDLTGLSVHRFTRDADWFGYIFSNRNRTADTLTADVVIGPIANDTIFDTFGIVSSGFLSPQEALSLLLIGPEYRQVVLKTQRAARQLRFLSAEVLSPDELTSVKHQTACEAAAYQAAFAKQMEALT